MALLNFHFLRIVHFKLFILLSTIAAFSQNASSQSPESKKFNSLDNTEKNELILLLREAAQLVTGIRVQEALEKIISAENIVNDYAPLFNLKGAAYTKIRDFDQAQSSFKKALELDPKGVMTKFNLNEMLFVKKMCAHYECAKPIFQQLARAHSIMCTKCAVHISCTLCNVRW